MARALRVPFGELGDMTRKQAITLNLFRLSSTSTTLPSLTTNFEMAERFGVPMKSVRVPAKSQPPLSRTFSGYPSQSSVREDAFGRWEAVPLPDGLTLDQVLARVVSVNSFCRDDTKNYLLKIKVRFSDSSEITFIRTDIHDPKSLVYDSYYNPNAHFDAATHPSPTRAGGALTAGGLLKSASAAFVKKGTGSTRKGVPELSALNFPKREVIHELFQRFDPNGNGVLSLAELDKCVSELWPAYNNKKAIMRAYRAADSNGSGIISKAEFPTFLRFLVNYNTVWAAFEGADRSRDHRLDFNEFVNAIKLFEPAKSERELRDLFAKMDANKGGYVLFDEFAAFIAQTRSNVIQPTNVRVSLPQIGKLRSKSLTAPAAAQSSPPRTLVVPSGDKLAELFDRLDPNANGMLSLAELDKGVIELWPGYNNKPAIMRAYKAADRNRTGWVSKGEFPFFLRYLQHYTNLWHSFATVDTSGDRRVSLQEFVAAAPRFNVASEADARLAFAQMDKNGGGFILFEEFADFMARTRAEFEARFDDRKGPIKRGVAKVKTIAKVKPLELPPNTTLQQLFARLDPNGNGMLSLAELDKGVVELFPSFNNKPAIMRAYKAADKNGTGWVSKGEFPFFLGFLVHYTNLFNAFKATDRDADRRVSLDEFVKGAAFIGVKLPNAELQRLFATMDKNQGGYVLFDEFASTLASIAARQD